MKDQKKRERKKERCWLTTTVLMEENTRKARTTNTIIKAYNGDDTNVVRARERDKVERTCGGEKSQKESEANGRAFVRGK
jgi:hypothetical protein